MTSAEDVIKVPFMVTWFSGRCGESNVNGLKEGQDKGFCLLLLFLEGLVRVGYEKNVRGELTQV